MKRTDKRQKFHQRVFSFLRPIAGPILRRIYAFRTDPLRHIEGPFLLLSNHVTAVDPILVCLSVKEQMYIVASEHLMQKGFGSKLLRYFFDPIVRRKGDSAVATVKSMLSALKAGQNVCVFPEGTCSYDGTNSPFVPTIGKLSKTAKAKLVTYRFEGGYFTLPRWGRGVRRGDFYGHIVRIYSPDELMTMTDAEINAHISEDLNEDAYARMAERPAAYKSRRRAEYLESAFFLCPCCRRVGTLRTKGDSIRCTCGMQATIDEHYRLSGMPVSTLPEWNALQNEWLSKASQDPDFAFSDEAVTLIQSDEQHRRTKLETGRMQLTHQALTVGTHTFPLKEIADVELVRRNRLVFSTANGYYQAIGADALNTRKYMLLYRIWKGTNVS